jgi:hypothetical protein
MILGIVSVLVTIIGVYIGVKYTFKQKRNTELTFLKNSCIPLFDAIVKNLDGIEINYQGEKIGENLILFKGTFINTGNVDIDNLIIHKPLSIKLPENCAWKEYKIIGSSNGLNIKVNKLKNYLEFEWELLKEGEHFTFDSLVEYNSNKLIEPEDSDLVTSLLNKISFDHRITNLKSLKMEDTISRPMSIGMVIFAVFTFIAFAIGGLAAFFSPNYEIYSEFKIDSTLYFAKLEPIDSNTIRLRNKNNQIIKNLSLNQFINQSTKKIVISKKTYNFVSFIFVGITTSVFLLIIIGIILTQVQKRRLFKKIKAVANEYGSGNKSDNVLLDWSIIRRLK